MSENRAQHLNEMVPAPFKKWNSFNNSRKDGKCSIDLVDSMIDYTPDLQISKCFSVIYYHKKTIIIPSETQILFNDLYMR